MIFENRQRNYPIQRLSDDAPGLSYKNGKSARMEGKVLNDWLYERRAVDKDPQGRTREVFMDSPSGQNETPPVTQSLQRISAKLQKLPANSTHLCQPLDSFVIQKIKEIRGIEGGRRHSIEMKQVSGLLV